MEYEYGIAHVTVDVDDKGNVTSVHRENMPQWLADQWIKEWEKDGGRKGVFIKIRKPIVQWEVVK